MKTNNRRELQKLQLIILKTLTITIFKNLYREFTKELYKFLTIDTTLQASEPLRFRKIYLILTKKTITDQIKIMQNEAQYNLDRKAAKISALYSNNLCKDDYLTGEDLSLKRSTAEQAKFEYSPSGKIFNRRLDKDDKEEGLFKRLKNSANKIKDENKLEPVKNGDQSEVLKDESTMVDKKPNKMALVKDELNYIFKNFGSVFNSTGKNFLIELAKDEKKRDYNNLIFETDNKFAVKSVNFLKEISTLYDLLIYLLSNSTIIITSTETQTDFLKATTVLEVIISNMKADISDQSEDQKKKIFCKTRKCFE